MRDLELGRVVRALRRRRGWRQEDCARRAGLHRSTWSLLERGHLNQFTLETLRRCLAALEVRLDLVPRWRGAGLDRLLDERHAALQAAWHRRLEAWGWSVRAEVSYSRYGERGRIDLLAWHPSLRIVLVIEIKTEIVDVQALLGGIDAKARLAPFIAANQGWRQPVAVVPVVVVADTSTNRRRLARVAPLFGRFSRRGKAAIAWLRRPGVAAEGLLVFSVLSSANTSRVRRAAARPAAQLPVPPSVDAGLPGA